MPFTVKTLYLTISRVTIKETNPKKLRNPKKPPVLATGQTTKEENSSIKRHPFRIELQSKT